MTRKPRRTIARLLRSIAPPLLLGALTNIVLVALIQFARPPMTSSGRFIGVGRGETRVTVVYRGLGHDRLSVHTFLDAEAGRPTFNIPSYAARQKYAGFDGKAGYWSYTWRVGWPFRCAYGCGYDGKFQAPVTPRRIEGFWVVRRSTQLTGQTVEPDGNGLYIPIRVAWAGMTLNTLIYSAAWWTLLFALGLTRAPRLGRKGNCPVCGYPIQGLQSALCPECGSALTA